MLKDLKMLLGLPTDDETLDDKLELILSGARSRLKALLGGIDPPEVLEYIITEVAVIRFNRIGSEGLSSHSVEGESLSFAEDDFAAYREDIQQWLRGHPGNSKGKVRFL